MRFLFPAWLRREGCVCHDRGAGTESVKETLTILGTKWAKMSRWFKVSLSGHTSLSVPHKTGRHPCSQQLHLIYVRFDLRHQPPEGSGGSAKVRVMVPASRTLQFRK